MKGEPITIYGDGKQVRDLLFVEDLVRAMRLAHENMTIAAGRSFQHGRRRWRTAPACWN